MSLPRLHTTIGGQQLRDPVFELEGGDDSVILQILEFPFGEIFPQLGPYILDGIQISTAGWEPRCCQTMLVVFIVDFQELLVIEPHPQPFEPGTLVGNNLLEIKSHKILTETHKQAMSN